MNKIFRFTKFEIYFGIFKKKCYGTCDLFGNCLENLLGNFGKFVGNSLDIGVTLALIKDLWNNWVVLKRIDRFCPQGSSPSHLRSCPTAQLIRQCD